MPALGDDVALRRLALAMGRVRLSAAVCLRYGGLGDARRVDALLATHAPAWRRATAAQPPGSGAPPRSALDGTMLHLERRVRAFVFAITGGNDKRARWVDQTWGERTPILWFGDVWDPVLRPIVDLHPRYLQNRFDWLTFKISRIWQRVYRDFFSQATAPGAAADPHLLNGNATVAPDTNPGPPPLLRGRVGGAAAPGSGWSSAPHYDWYGRLWDDNYVHEENWHNVFARFDADAPTMLGKMAWRNLGTKPTVRVIFPFAGGGAGWFLSHGGMARLGPSVPAAERWFDAFRARRDIFLPHAIHDEDVFLTAWLHLRGVRFGNAPGVEHVSPGLSWRQRCLTDATLRQLRWNASATIYFDYPAKEAQFRVEDAVYVYHKPIVWHYMSPSRLVHVETLLYPWRAAAIAAAGEPPKTNSDQAKPKKRCYPGVPTPPPPSARSLFESPLADPPPAPWCCGAVAPAP